MLVLLFLLTLPSLWIDVTLLLIELKKCYSPEEMSRKRGWGSWFLFSGILQTPGGILRIKHGMLYLSIQASSTKEHRWGNLQRPELYWCKLVLESGYPRTGCQCGSVVVRACFRSHTAEFSLYDHRAGEGLVCIHLFYKGTIFFCEVSIPTP